jgi:hypothetical protein
LGDNAFLPKLLVAGLVYHGVVPLSLVARKLAFRLLERQFERPGGQFLPALRPVCVLAFLKIDSDYRPIDARLQVDSIAVTVPRPRR